MRKKNIVVLIDWFLPGNKAGGPVKSIYSMLQILSPYFNFSVITTNKDLGSDAAYSNVESNCWTSYKGISVYYFSKEKLRPKNLLTVIQSQKPDTLYINSFWSYKFSILPLRFFKSKQLDCQVVLAPRGMLGKGAMSIKSLKKNLVLKLLKIVKLHSNVIFQATTADEENEIKSFLKEAVIKIAPNINSSSILESRTIKKEVNQLNLFFLSRISRVKNLHFAIEQLASLKIEGQINYSIFGAIEDKIYWNECEELIRKLPTNIKVYYKGELSFDDVQSNISQHHALFLPTLNENFGHSIAETLKSGCPVIISTNTPWNSVNAAECGFAINLSDKKDFNTVLCKLVEMDQVHYNRMSENCLKFMSEKVNLDNEINAYQNLFNE